MTGFNLFIKLTQIIAFVLRTLVRDSHPFTGIATDYCVCQYAADKSKVLHGVKIKRWREEVVLHADKAMSEWMASVPEHRMS